AATRNAPVPIPDALTPDAPASAASTESDAPTDSALPSDTPTQSESPAASESASPDPIGTSSPVPTPHPTALPFVLGPPGSLALEPISAQNASRIVELAHLGKGLAREALWSPDGRQVAVAS